MRKIARARELRRESTDAERALWRALRSRQVGGVKFRRQHPLGPYVVDFLCYEHKLVVEVDGGQHALSPSDGARTRWLEANGFRVIRFWNNDVLTRTEGVLTEIIRQLRR
jgi:very-short-patch-repair endonuclease